jgi:septum formation protein
MKERGSMAVTTDLVRAHLILGSSSPRRKELLGGLGIRFMVSPSTIDETLMPQETPEGHVTRLALAKAREVAALFPGQWVLGADTIVVIEGRILGKPRDTEEARNMLATLSGRTHTVFTGYALVNQLHPEKERVRHVCSRVHIRGLSADEIAAYVDTGEPMDKAGSYAIQGIGAAIVADVTGSYTNVVGLPLCEVAQDLQELGIFDFLGRNGTS